MAWSPEDSGAVRGPGCRDAGAASSSSLTPADEPQRSGEKAAAARVAPFPQLFTEYLKACADALDARVPVSCENYWSRLCCQLLTRLIWTS